MKQALLKKGMVFPIDLPKPSIKEGYVKIKVYHSCISAGTEISGVAETRKSLLRKAIDDPKKIATALDYLNQRGFKKTKNKLEGISDQYKEIGYSLAGKIVEVSESIKDLRIGDLVSAGGMRMAVHAEYVVVPRNLVVKIPIGLSTLEASTGTIGAISLHAVRRSDLKIGEYGVVIGAGLLGQFAIQILKASGVRVACVDLNESRLDLAISLGAEIAINSNLEDPVKNIRNWSGGFGADAVLFAASTTSSKPLSQAFQMTRKKGKVILVGVSGMEIEREDMYTDEIDFLISTSYGPGRYDESYELEGVDYPYHYVRWTENRNISEFLRLLLDGSIDIKKLFPMTYKFQDIESAFRNLETNPDSNMLSILEYEPNTEEECLELEPIVIEKKADDVNKKTLNIGIIGAGRYASETLLPIVNELKKEFTIHTIVDRSGKKSFDLMNKFSAKKASSEISDIINNDDIDIVMIATRHSNHAELAIKCLEAGKHVFVEKPLATSQEQLDNIIKFFEVDSQIAKPILMVGFNRRFSPFIEEVKKHVDRRINPLFIQYNMNAGFATSNSWLHKDGGRIVGEACHLIDLMIYLSNSDILEISVNSLSPTNSVFQQSDNKSIVLKFKDGSIAGINYFSLGSPQLSKERLEVHFDMKSIIINDFKSISGFDVIVSQPTTKLPQKGHKEELMMVYKSVINGKWPIPLKDLVQTTRATFLSNLI